MAPEQLGLRYNDRWHFTEEWHAILDEIRSIVSSIGLKQVAFDLDIQPSQLAHAIAERERHRVAAEWMPYFLAKAPTDRLARLLARMAGFDIVPRREMSAEEKLKRLEGALAKELGPSARRAVLEEAFGPGAKP